MTTEEVSNLLSQYIASGENNIKQILKCEDCFREIEASPFDQTKEERRSTILTIMARECKMFMDQYEEDQKKRRLINLYAEDQKKRKLIKLFRDHYKESMNKDNYKGIVYAHSNNGVKPFHEFMQYHTKCAHGEEDLYHLFEKALLNEDVEKGIEEIEYFIQNNIKNLDDLKKFLDKSLQYLYYASVKFKSCDQCQEELMERPLTKKERKIHNFGILLKSVKHAAFSTLSEENHGKEKYLKIQKNWFRAFPYMCAELSRHLETDSDHKELSLNPEKDLEGLETMMQESETLIQMIKKYETFIHFLQENPEKNPDKYFQWIAKYPKMELCYHDEKFWEEKITKMMDTIDEEERKIKKISEIIDSGGWSDFEKKQTDDINQLTAATEKLKKEEEECNQTIEMLLEENGKEDEVYKETDKILSKAIKEIDEIEHRIRLKKKDLQNLSNFKDSYLSGKLEGCALNDSLQKKRKELEKIWKDFEDVKENQKILEEDEFFTYYKKQRDGNFSKNAIEFSTEGIPYGYEKCTHERFKDSPWLKSPSINASQKKIMGQL